MELNDLYNQLREKDETIRRASQIIQNLKKEFQETLQQLAEAQQQIQELTYRNKYKNSEDKENDPTQAQLQIQQQQQEILQFKNVVQLHRGMQPMKYVYTTLDQCLKKEIQYYNLREQQFIDVIDGFQALIVNSFDAVKKCYNEETPIQQIIEKIKQIKQQIDNDDNKIMEIFKSVGLDIKKLYYIIQEQRQIINNLLNKPSLYEENISEQIQQTQLKMNLQIEEINVVVQELSSQNIQLKTCITKFQEEIQLNKEKVVLKDQNISYLEQQIRQLENEQQSMENRLYKKERENQQTLKLFNQSIQDLEKVSQDIEKLKINKKQTEESIEEVFNYLECYIDNRDEEIKKFYSVHPFIRKLHRVLLEKSESDIINLLSQIAVRILNISDYFDKKIHFQDITQRKNNSLKSLLESIKLLKEILIIISEVFYQFTVGLKDGNLGTQKVQVSLDQIEQQVINFVQNI